MGEQLHQSFVVENHSGASGLIAAEDVAKSTADGYTMLMAPSQLSTYRALYPHTRFDPQKDLAPVGLVATSPYVMVVHPSLPVNDLPGLLAYAKAHPNELSYAGSTPGSAQHLSWELIKRNAGVQMQYIPYKGTSALMPDLLAGRLKAGIDNVAILTPYIKSGQLRGIAVTSPEKTALLPDLPTVAASANMPGFQALGWFGLFTPKGVAPEKLATLNDALRKVMASKEVQDTLTGIGAETRSGSAQELQALLAHETTVWSKVIKDSGITIN
ncbi:hypothetical protein CAL29_24065 [Bordetella genomosp. 10]|uniref:ABC transporter substrate-binding protein n=1 Tax=Bordetella genomosp. 10 TaxID=1416804 RepID=A0A261S108_9BORD|nr:tripartite tricarboxylate transporter substrate-binding protein [Bordetella genomosp. 10]OZI31026.1 hypothetical protein CAL29_24065 [Bordetella genomosp. 10]